MVAPDSLKVTLPKFFMFENNSAQILCCNLIVIKALVDLGINLEYFIFILLIL